MNFRAYLIAIIISIFVVAFFVGQCNSSEVEDQNRDVFVEGINEYTDVKKEFPEFEENLKTSVKDEDTIWLARLIKNEPEQILCRTGYTTSYNEFTKNANWVAWHLTKEHTDGPYSRDGIGYLVDEDVDGEKAELEDWYGHGLPIDHGHLCPAGDNKWDEDAMIESFYLTNMCPQNSQLNRGDWEELEDRCRGWARHYGEIFIVAGPIFYDDNYAVIGDNSIAVPQGFFKVVLKLGKNPMALGFIYPNESVNNKMSSYVRTVDEVEEITGIDFFYNLPDDVEEAVESKSEFNKW